jgi:hypothetical protein
MRIGIASDHSVFELKVQLTAACRKIIEKRLIESAENEQTRTTQLT